MTTARQGFCFLQKTVTDRFLPPIMTILLPEAEEGAGVLRLDMREARKTNG
jgi:hypothetical protein